jgi:hypothetical protein
MDQWKSFENAVTDSIKKVEVQPYEVSNPQVIRYKCVRCGLPSGPDGHPECFD